MNRRPRSTPAGARAREEAASTVFDRRPPWSLPLDSVFAPRVAGAVQVTRFFLWYELHTIIWAARGGSVR